MKTSMILLLVWLQLAVPFLHIFAQDSPPFTPSWKVDYGLASMTSFLGPSSLPLGVYVSGSSAYGFSLKDGSTLWKANQSIEFQNETYYASVSSGNLLNTEDGSYLVVSNYALTVPVFPYEYHWMGFYLRDLKTGRLKADVGLDPSRSSSVAVLTQTGDIFVVDWAHKTPQGRENVLLQLRGPDFSPDTPAATFVWPSDGTVSSSPPLILLQKTNVLLIFTAYTDTNATLLRLNPSRSKGDSRITVDWRVDIGFSAPSFVPSQDESKLYALVRSDQSPTTVRRLDVKTGKIDWVWTRADLGQMNYLIVTGDVDEKASGRRFLCGYTSTYTPQQTVIQYAYCADQQNDFALSFNFSLGESPNLNKVFGVYKRWLLVKEDATGDLLAYNPFSGTTKEGEEPKPEWKLSGQRDLQQLLQPIDGKGTSEEYAIASYYPSTLARWAVKA